MSDVKEIAEEMANGVIFFALMEENAELRKKLSLAREALNSLCNEAQGFLSMADINVHGYTNMQVLDLKITKAREALAAIDKGE